MLHVAGLESPPRAARRRDEERRAVDGAVDQRRVDPARADPRRPEERAHDDRVVELVDAELVTHERVEAVERRGDARRHVGAEHVQPVREPEAPEGDRRREREHPERRLRRLGVTEERGERRGHGKPSAAEREHAEHDQRDGHHAGRLVRMVMPPRRPEKGETEEPARVVGGEERDDEADEPEDGRGMRPGERAPEDLVLAEEARERRDAGDRRGADRHGREGDRQMGAQSAHPAHVLLAAEGVDDAAGAEKEERLEERMRDEVEEPRGVRAGPDPQEHVAELRDRGIREDALDVPLFQGDRRGEEGGEGAHPGHRRAGERR